MSTVSKSFLTSILLHALIVISYFIYFHNEKKEPIKKEKIVTMNLTTYQVVKKENPQPIVKPPEPEPIPEPIVTPPVPVVKKEVNKVEKLTPKPQPKKVTKKIIKKVVKKKVVKPKPKPKPKKIIKKKIVPKPKKVIKKVEPIEPIIPVQAQPVIEKPKPRPVVNVQEEKKIYKKASFGAIRNMVLPYVKYPKIAKRMGWQGIVKVALVIDSNGKVIRYEIHKSSGRKHLDTAALKAVKKVLGKQFPKPKHQTKVILPIGFNLS